MLGTEGSQRNLFFRWYIQQIFVEHVLLSDIYLKVHICLIRASLVAQMVKNLPVM